MDDALLVPKPPPNAETVPNASNGVVAGGELWEGVGSLIDDDVPKLNVGGEVELPGGLMFKNELPYDDAAGVLLEEE